MAPDGREDPQADARSSTAPPPADAADSMLNYREVLARAREQASREYFIALLRTLNGNVSRAAQRAGVERESLHRLLRRLGIDANEFRRESMPPSSEQAPSESSASGRAPRSLRPVLE